MAGLFANPAGHNDLLLDSPSGFGFAGRVTRIQNGFLRQQGKKLNEGLGREVAEPTSSRGNEKSASGKDH